MVDSGQSWPSLDGLNALIVEDEAIVSFLIEDMLVELGCAAVWHAGSVAQALARIGSALPDFAILDVNLGGTPVYPVAERLRAANVPFVFATGYGRGGVDDAWSGNGVIAKPFDIAALRSAVQAALAT